MSATTIVQRIIGIEEVNIEPSRQKRLRRLCWLIVWAHVGAIGVSAGLTWYFSSLHKDSLEIVVVFLHVLSFAAFVIGMLILLLSALNEALARETLDTTKRSSHATTHKFTTFNSQLNWLKDNLSADHFNSRTVDFYVSVSTPLYGIAAGSDEAERFLNYLDGWLEHFESLPENNPDKPSIAFACWNAEDNINTFQDAAISTMKQEGTTVLMHRFSQQLSRLYAIGRSRKAHVHFNYSDRNDSRIFMTADAKNNSYSGLLVVQGQRGDTADVEAAGHAEQGERWCVVGIVGEVSKPRF